MAASSTSGWQSVYRRTNDAVTRTIAGETLLVPIVGQLAHLQEIFALDEVAAFIWQQLDGHRCLEEILHHLIDEFEVERSRAEKDLLSFLDQLLEVQLILPVER